MLLKTEDPQPFTAKGLPEGVTSAKTEYRRPGLRTKSPIGPGWWEFRTVQKLYYRGKLFAVVGPVYFPSANIDYPIYPGCVVPVVIYDDDGDGVPESPEQSAVKDYVFHLPKWIEAISDPASK